MSKRFVKKWAEPEKMGIRETIRPPRPLRPRIEQAARRVEVQIQRLEQEGSRLTARDKSMFAKIVEAYTIHDSQRANVLANELTEIRKMEKFLAHAGLALEQVVLRLNTVSELGDTVVTLAPAVSVLQSVRVGIAGILPGVDRELGQVGTLLSEIIMESGQGTSMILDFGAANEDAQKILEEAAIVAEQRVKQKFPELPEGVPSPGGQLSISKNSAEP